MKKYLFLIISAFLILASFFILTSFSFISVKKPFPSDVKLCSDGSLVYRVLPNCEFTPCPGEKEGILISFPKRNQQIFSPLKIIGKAKGLWFFEGEFTAELLDENKNLLGKAILNAKDDWMSNDYVNFEGELNFNQSNTRSGVLRFLSANPSGMPENQKIFEMPVNFSDSMKVLLYYYNPEKDKDDLGNILCSEKGLVAIERFLPKTQTPIKDTLLLFLRGKENLSRTDIVNGITTEFPLKGLKLIEVNLKEDGTLIIRLEDPFYQTSGGSCRVKILQSQLEATLKQFPQVKTIKFLPEELFQP